MKASLLCLLGLGSTTPLAKVPGLLNPEEPPGLAGRQPREFEPLLELLSPGPGPANTIRAATGARKVKDTFLPSPADPTNITTPSTTTPSPATTTTSSTATTTPLSSPDSPTPPTSSAAPPASSATSPSSSAAPLLTRGQLDSAASLAPASQQQALHATSPEPLAALQVLGLLPPEEGRQPRDFEPLLELLSPGPGPVNTFQAATGARKVKDSFLPSPPDPTNSITPSTTTPSSATTTPSSSPDSPTPPASSAAPPLTRGQLDSAAALAPASLQQALLAASPELLAALQDAKPENLRVFLTFAESGPTTDDLPASA